MPNPSAAVLQPQALFHGRYLIIRCMKAGGMGAVYEVIDERTNHRRALKVMLPSLLDNEILRARFAQEARVTGGIESDHIVLTTDAGVDEDTETPFLVMELLRGEDLGSVVEKRFAVPSNEVTVYLYQTALALDKTHAAGIVHRDLKPDNLFLTTRDDGSPCVKILDFGIAKVLQQNSPSLNTRPMMGTPLYMSPEQVRNEPDIGPRADIYAVGHIAYTLLAGEPYWQQEAENVLSPYLLITEIMQGVQEMPAARAMRRSGVTLPPAFDAWFLKTTAMTQADRFERATSAVRALIDVFAMSPPPPSVRLADSGCGPAEPRATMDAPPALKPMGSESGVVLSSQPAELAAPAAPPPGIGPSTGRDARPPASEKQARAFVGPVEEELIVFVEWDEHEGVATVLLKPGAVGRTPESIVTWKRQVSVQLERFGRKVPMLICVDGGVVSPNLAEQFGSAAKEILDRYATRFARYGTATGLRMISAVESMKRGYKPNLFEDRASALAFLKGDRSPPRSVK